MREVKLALVTGASSGIGAALTRMLTKRGVQVIACGRDEERLDRVTAATGAEPFKCDLMNRARLVELIHTRAPDLVINCAGYGIYGPALAHDTSEALDLLEVNGNAVVELTLEAARTLFTLKEGGVIVNISSAAGHIPFPGGSAYAASKAMVTSISQSLDSELKSLGIRVLVSCPGEVVTRFRERASGGIPQKRDRLAMPVEKAAKRIIRQIQKSRRVDTFDWRTRFAIWVARLPGFKRLSQKLIQTRLMGRHKSHKLKSLND